MGCACRCRCLNNRVDDADGLCAKCWQEWCHASEDHAPVADASYLGTYGITGIWTGWLISRAAHLVAETPAKLHSGEYPPMCSRSHPDGGHQMVSRLGAWKCYRHDDDVVVPKVTRLPRAPAIDVVLSPGGKP